jgi:hypothetical protein
MIVFAVQISQIIGIPDKLVRLVIPLHVQSPIVNQMSIVNTIAVVLRIVIVIDNRFWQEKLATTTKNHCNRKR